ncbi:cupin domain-containing protein [Pseudomonas sp. v388]|uniref:cupin domain-containing protein n=1 Tax=Pseudomonas sp. v388 TaxID=2479849 RepID=UPI000F76BECE|nr:cupin domain-containing protein [Pseudomonas sp. v388]RRV10612.1 cupin domain-containing protein [Pseudomonas sp. v388]
MTRLDPHFNDQDLELLVPQPMFFEDDGAIPNNRFPVLIYTLQISERADAAAAFEGLFARHQWTPLWRDGVFDYHHYHSTAHEALGVASGEALLRLGGEQGQDVSVKAGDVLILPAGTGHCRLRQSADFLVVGAYPKGQEDYDIQRPERADHDAAVQRIAAVALPTQDPVTGAAGFLVNAWVKA